MLELDEGAAQEAASVTGSRSEPASLSESAILRLIADFDRHVTRLGVAEFAQEALRFLAARLNIARASIALLRSEGDGFLICNDTVSVGGIEAGSIVPHGSGTLTETVADQRTIFRANIRNWAKPNEVDRLLLQDGLTCTISVPLLIGAECIGSLNVAWHAPDEMHPSARRILEFLAPRLAQALRVSRDFKTLTASETRFREVFDTVSDGILVTDGVTQQVLLVNSTLCKLLGRNQTESWPLSLVDLQSEEHSPAILELFESVARGETEQAQELPMLRADGVPFLADVTVKRAILSGRHCLVGVFRDSTARRERQAEQIQLQKLESIRTLAAGIAHDFNNFLTGIIGTVTLAQLELEPEHESWKLLGEAQRCATRATALTRQLLAFAKGGTPLCAKLTLNQVVQDSASLATSGTNVRCQIQLPHHHCWVLGDEGQLSQVVQNLVRNAVEAMPHGGEILVTLSPPSETGSNEARLDVRDSGPGIPTDLLDKIYIPFFTTKKSGSGLGLSIAWSVVQSHGGRLSVSSKVGVGTTFSVHLPVIATTFRTTTPPGTPVLTRGAGRVMVMDDQPLVLSVAVRALQSAGYDVSTAQNEKEAIEAYRTALSAGTRFDAVVLDLTIPGGMGGQEVAKQILSLDPTARLIASSGYSDDSVMSDFARYGFLSALPKPYGVRQLCHAIADLIARPVGKTSTASSGAAIRQQPEQVPEKAPQASRNQSRCTG